MMRQNFFMAAFFLVATFPVSAGTITNGVWTSSCGTEPVPPAVESATIEAYNASIKVVNEWQTTASTFNACLIKDANTDNTVIAKSTNDSQARLKAAIEKIKTEAAAAVAKLSAK